MFIIHAGSVNLYVEFIKSKGYVNTLWGKKFSCEKGKKPNLYVDLSDNLKTKNKHSNRCIDAKYLIENISDIKYVSIDNTRKINNHIVKMGINELWDLILNIDKEYTFKAIVVIKEDNPYFIIKK
jgi:hypothetical protein